VSATAPTLPQATAAQAAAPGWGARLGCLLYEGVLLFGVITGLVVLPAVLLAYLLRSSPGLLSPTVLGIWFFVALGGYFIYFWSRSGQTLAMLTWRIRLVTAQGTTLTPARAAARYVLSWMWVLPAPLIVHLSGLRGWGPFLGALMAGMLGYAALARLHPDRQYWHDALCRTRLIRWNPPRP
jgi:uncharacterized RDD family membrane protein YckC